MELFMDHHCMGIFFQNFVLFYFVAREQEQEKVKLKIIIQKKKSEMKRLWLASLEFKVYQYLSNFSEYL